MTTAVAKFIIRHYMKAQARRVPVSKLGNSVRKVFEQHGGQYNAFMKAKAHLIHNKRVKAGTYKWSDGNKSWKSSSGEGRENYRASQAKTGPLVGRARYGLDK